MAREGTVTTRPRAQSFIIKRPRLTKLLDESEARIILLVAPAGYGKTTLAREWLEGREGVLWYSGRPAMADVAALASGLVSAFAQDEDVRERALERVQILATRGQSPEALAKAVVSAIPATASMLVIDDCHLAASPESEDLLAALTVDTTIRVVLVSRTRPGWITARMLVYAEARMLEMADLAFTEEEARIVIGEERDKETGDLVVRAHGWPAVIGLAAQHGRAGLSVMLPSDDLYGFFAEDLFRHAEPELQEALIVLALGGDTNADIARELLGENQEEILEDAWEHGFLGPDARRLEIHPLLRAFLLERLSDLTNARAERIVRTTVGVLADSELWDECLSALQAHPVADIIASILAESMADILASGRITTVKRWLDLARANAVSDPMLVLAEAEIALRDRDDRRALMLGAHAGSLLGSGEAAARAYVVAARAAHFCEDLEAVTKYAQLAVSSTDTVEPQTAALWVAFSSAAEHSLSEADSVLDRLAALDDSRPDHAVRILHAQGLLLMNADGNARTAADKCELALALLTQVRDPFVKTGILNLLSYISVMLARYDRGLGLTDELLAEAASTGLDFAVDHALVVRSSALIGLRRLSEAQRSLSAVRARSDQASAHILGNAQLQEIRLRIASGDLTRASVLVQREPADSSPPAFVGEFLAHRGLVFAALGEARPAEQAVNAARLQPGWIGATFLADMAQAILTLQQTGEEASELCIKLLMRAYEQGHLDAVVTAARACPNLVRVGSSDDNCARALTEILSSSSDIDLGRRAGLAMPRILARREPLSPREREVYELIIQGRSIRAIANTLFISESTTKVHVRHIYEKLGVHTRTELVRTSLTDLRP